MFSLAYIILPFSNATPADAITASLARYRRGGRGEVPEEWLQFHDQTAEVRSMHEATFTFTTDNGLRIEGGESWQLDSRAVRDEMERRGKDQWTVRFADLEPDIERFARRFVKPLERHPVTGGFGRWLNPLGRWDWWELGGRFDGRISGSPRRAGRATSVVSSGPSRGRAALERLQDAFGDALGQAVPPMIDVRADDNVELVSKLWNDLREEGEGSVPGALVLPPGSLDDSLRWISSWPSVSPPETLASFGLPERAEWNGVIAAVYAHFASHWAAGVSFHH